MKIISNFYINDATNSKVCLYTSTNYRKRYQHTDIRNQAMANCALCTCAAIINYALGHEIKENQLWQNEKYPYYTSGDVAKLVKPNEETLNNLHRDFNGVYPYYQHAESFTGKAYINMKNPTEVSQTQIGGMLSCIKSATGLDAYGESHKDDEKKDKKSYKDNPCKEKKDSETPFDFITRICKEKYSKKHLFGFAIDGHWTFGIYRPGLNKLLFYDYQMHHKDFYSKFVKNGYELPPHPTNPNQSQNAKRTKIEDHFSQAYILLYPDIPGISYTNKFKDIGFNFK